MNVSSVHGRLFTAQFLTWKQFFFFSGVMKVGRTKPGSCQTNDSSVPPAFQNDVTHWWDGSQLYGSDKETLERVRSFTDGKLKVDDDGFLPLDPKTNIDITGNVMIL